MGARKCFYIPESQFVEGRGYIPSLVTEDEPGHAPLVGNGPYSEPWYWGMTLATAQTIAAKANADLGLTANDVRDIITSSVVASNRHDASRDRMERKLAGHNDPPTAMETLLRDILGA